MTTGLTRKRFLLLSPAALALLVAGVGAWHDTVRLGSYPSQLLEPRRAASLTVLDRQGQILRQVATESGGRESWVPLARISPHLRRATLAAEDHRFFAHAGVDWRALARSCWLNLRARRMAFGGSTLTMQLVRLVERRPRSLQAKLGELLLAARLERVLSKEQILEHYLNRTYYGSGAWGAEAAARLYFGKPSSHLSVGEAAFLAVLPRGPESYHPYRNLDAALRRRSRILELMARRGLVSVEDRALAERSPLALRRERPDFRAAHFVDHVLSSVPAEQRRGATIRTTLDGPLQEQIEVALRRHLDRVRHLGISQAAIVVLGNADGALLALVGSRDYLDSARRGAVNGATARHRPGSTLKPFIYALALERGDTAATVAYDVILPHEVGESYTTEVRQHGFARYRESLAGSYNLAAVHTLGRVGVESLLDRLRRAGVGTLDWPDDHYRLDLAIGEAEVRLHELTAAFALFGRGGRALRPRAIDSVQLPGERPRRWPRDPALTRVYSPQVAYLIFDILRDPDARRPMFGDGVPLALPFPVALKTGTTRAYTDDWSFGVTREYTVGVWAGNFDGSPTHGIMAMRGATPLVRAAYSILAARFGAPSAPERPAGIVEDTVCPLSGMRPGPHCERHKRELFLAGSVPRGRCTWHTLVCGRPAVRYPVEVESWARAQHLLREPDCAEGQSLADAIAPRILYPLDGAQFALDPFRPARHQVPPLRAAPRTAEIRWTVDGVPAERWQPTPGAHRVRAELANSADEITVHYY